ncbi:MAG: ABC transporter substrate-binding protein [Alphaproteobacteria bacterium]
MKKIILFLSIGLMAIALIGCNSQQDTGKVKVGILQIIDHPSLNQSREGFIEELKNLGYTEGNNLEIDYQNAQGDAANLKSMSTKLAKDSDLILAIGTPSAQAVANETKDIPILFTATTDPVTAGLVKDLNNVGGNISGTSDMSPVKEQLTLLENITPGIKTVGLLYNAGEANSKVSIDIAKKELAAKNLNVVEKTVTNPNDVKQAVEVLAGEVEGIYIPTDNVVASAMPTVGDVAKKNKIPVVTGSTDMALEGGLATYGIDYNKLGRQTAAMAAKILKKEAKVQDMPVEYASENILVVNEEMAKALVIDPASITADGLSK